MLVSIMLIIRTPSLGIRLNFMECKGWMEEGDARETKVVNDELDNEVWDQIKLRIFKVKGWKEDDVEVERRNGSISDWDGKLAWVEERGAGLQGMWQWGGWGCVPLATAVICMEFPLTTLLEAMDNAGEDDGDRTALILLHACRNYHTLSLINSMWSARF